MTSSNRPTTLTLPLILTLTASCLSYFPSDLQYSSLAMVAAVELLESIWSILRALLAGRKASRNCKVALVRVFNPGQVLIHVSNKSFGCSSGDD